MRFFAPSRLLFLCSLLLFVVGCSKMNKEEYLSEYKAFVSDVSQKASSLNEDDWKEYDEQYHEYSSEMRQDYTKEFTWKDELLLAKLDVQYNVLRSQKALKSQIKAVFNDINEVKNQVKHYMENDMQEDLDFLVEQSKELGGEMEKAVNEMIKEIEEQEERLSK